jgi:hypothetical protein
LGCSFSGLLEAEAPAAAARDRAKQAAEAETAVTEAEAADAGEQQKLREKAAKAREKAETARELAIEQAKEAGLEPHGLEPDAMPYRGLAHRAQPSCTAQFH